MAAGHERFVFSAREKDASIAASKCIQKICSNMLCFQVKSSDFVPDFCALLKLKKSMKTATMQQTDVEAVLQVCACVCTQ